MTVRVSTIRFQRPTGFGGVIFSGVPVDAAGSTTDASTYLVVRASRAVLGPTRVERGQWWSVRGPVVEREVTTDGYRLTELQLDADEARLARPSGEHIVRYLAENSAFEGIGTVKAQRLWDEHGERLYEVLDGANTAALAKTLTQDVAERLVQAWASQGESLTLQWLHAHGFEPRLGRKVLAYFGSDARESVEEDPYRLLSFCANWKTVDRLAREKFSVSLNDPRRMRGAVEEACYRAFADGHTAMLSAELMERVEPLLGKPPPGVRWRDQLTLSVTIGLENGSFVKSHHGLQPLGAMVMERQVAHAIYLRLSHSSAPLLAGQAVDQLISEVNAMDGVVLNTEQQAAIHAASTHEFLCITGGAGVGKTTALKALYRLFDVTGVRVFQVALAGRAAKRMHEATGRPAQTIASFLKGFEESQMEGATALVIDEASMVDVISMSRLCSVLPRHVRLILVGDPHQLMPVGPGLVLHAIQGAAGVPTVELKTVKRYGGAIAAAAADIRVGRWPMLMADEAEAVAFLPCPDEAIGETVVELMALDPGNSQTLCAVRNGPAGTKAINALCQERFTAGAPEVMAWNDEFDCFERVGFRVGDVVLCTRNLWSIGLQNGSLGRVVEVGASLPPTASEAGDDDTSPPLALVEWDDGQCLPLTGAMLDDVELGFAVTVHKAQGSQWQRVIVPVTHNRMLDRTLLYTAVTRAQKQVLLVGNEAAARDAVLAPPRSTLRQVGLDLHLASMRTTSAPG